MEGDEFETLTILVGIPWRVPDHESRGVITVADRTGLEEAACECYGIIRGHFSRLLPGTYSRRFD